MDMKFGLFGGGWQDYHDTHVKPVLDELDRQIDDIRVNGAEGQLARVQELDGRGGYENSPEFTQSMALNAPTAAPAGSYGSDMPIATRNEKMPPDLANGNEAYSALNSELNRRHVLGKTFPDFNTALGAWADAAQPYQKQFGTELNSKIYAVPGEWQVGSAYSSGAHCSEGGICTTPISPNGDVPGGLYWGYIHTHPDNSAGLSPWDIDTAKSHAELGVGEVGGGAFVSLPNGQINGWNFGMPGPENQYIIRPPRK